MTLATRGFATAAGAPADWSAIGARSHAVQFYQTEGHLLDLLARYVGTALVTGDVAVVVATRAHRDGLAKRLRRNGLDISVPREQGRYVALDAEAALARVSADGRIDAARFRAFFGEIFDRIVRAGERRRVVAFGEIVALLWAQGKPESAIQLEDLWNELAREYAFGLCCAYPMNGFGNRHAAPFLKICAQHSHVFTVAQASGPAVVASR